MSSPIDMCALADVKAYLNINNTTVDNLLSGLITAASRFIITYCNRNFLSQSYNENRGSVVGQSRWVTLGYPIQSVQSVSVCGQSIPSAGAGWPRSGYSNGAWYIAVDGYCIPPGERNVQISYTAGYTTYPEDLTQACIELVALKYRQKDYIGIAGNKSIDGQSTSFRDISMPESVRQTLQQYKRVIQVEQ